MLTKWECISRAELYKLEGLAMTRANIDEYLDDEKVTAAYVCTFENVKRYRKPVDKENRGNVTWIR